MKNKQRRENGVRETYLVDEAPEENLEGSNALQLFVLMEEPELKIMIREQISG